MFRKSRCISPQYFSHEKKYVVKETEESFRIKLEFSIANRKREIRRGKTSIFPRRLGLLGNRRFFLFQFEWKIAESHLICDITLSGN